MAPVINARWNVRQRQCLPQAAILQPIGKHGHTGQVAYDARMTEEQQPALREVAATRLRHEWKQVLLATANDDEQQVVVRYRGPAAVLVPPYWHALAVKALGPAETEVLTSNDARGAISSVLTQTEEHGRHHVITVDGYEVAVLVPVAWHRKAVDALNPQSAPQADKSS